MKKNVKKKMNGAFDSEHTCILELQLSYLYLLAISIKKHFASTLSDTCQVLVITAFLMFTSLGFFWGVNVVLHSK